MSLLDVAEDNWLRFLALPVLERVMIIRQTSLVTTSHAFKFSDTLSSNFALARSNSLLRGAFKGNLLNTIQFIGTYGQAILLSNRNAASFATTAIILDAILHPLDTIRVRWTGDVKGAYKSLYDCAAKTSPLQLLNGFFFKLAYSAIMSYYIVNLGTHCPTDPISIATLVVAYPFLTLKAAAQASDKFTLGVNFTGNSSQAGSFNPSTLLTRAYRGFVPFLALNMLAPYLFPQIWSKDKLKQIHEEETKQMAHIYAYSSGQR